MYYLNSPLPSLTLNIPFPCFPAVPHTHYQWLFTLLGNLVNMEQITMSISQNYVDQIHVTTDAFSQLNSKLKIYSTSPAGDDEQFLYNDTLYQSSTWPECHFRLRLFGIWSWKTVLIPQYMCRKMRNKCVNLSKDALVQYIKRNCSENKDEPKQWCSPLLHPIRAYALYILRLTDPDRGIPGLSEREK